MTVCLQPVKSLVSRASQILLRMRPEVQGFGLKISYELGVGLKNSIIINDVNCAVLNQAALRLRS